MTVAIATVRELLGRRVLLWGAGLSALFIGLYTLGLILLRREMASELDVVAATVLAILALYVVSFLGSFLGLVLSAGSVASEIDGGLIHAVLARPLSRRRWLGERWLAIAVIVSVYTVVMGAAMIALAGAVFGYSPAGTAPALALMALEVLIMVTLGVFFSTRTSAVATGVILFASFGVAWMGGIVEFIGRTMSNGTMVDLGVATSLLMPTDGLWKAASYYASTPEYLADLGSFGLPFASTSPPAAPFVLWAAGYVVLFGWLAVRGFDRRDL